MKSPDNRDFVLVVDDSPEELGMLTAALEDAGLAVLVARDGTRALSLLDRAAPDVILMDAVMPGIDGFETCRRIKQKPDMRHVPVIFMTGLSDTEDILRGLGAGGVDYVTKPVAPDELIARIGVHIANARLANSARTALDVAGQSLMALNRDLEVLWCTPEAARSCNSAGCTGPDGAVVLPPKTVTGTTMAAAAKAPTINTVGTGAKRFNSNDVRSSIGTITCSPCAMYSEPVAEPTRKSERTS